MDARMNGRKLAMTSQLLWLAAIVAMGAVVVLQQWLHHKQTTMLMRSFLDKQGIPLHIMDSSPAPEPITPSAPLPRKRISIPIPGVNWRKA
jgi:hypothetical protein